MKIFNKFDMKFYKTDISNREYWINFVNSCDDIISHIKYRSIIFVEKEKLITILFEWSGLYDLLHFFNQRFIDEKSKRSLFIVHYDVDRAINNLSTKITEVLKYFKDMAIVGEQLILYRKIVPDKALIKKDKLVDIPEEDRVPINRLEINTDPFGSITSVKIDSKHPNADDSGWFCLGELKSIPLSVEAINRIICQMKCYHLMDCYWRPTNYKKWN